MTARLRSNSWAVSHEGIGPLMGSAALSFGSAFLISLASGGPAIKSLSRMGARQTVSDDAPSRHQEKQGTPTMGGIIILFGLLATMALVFALMPSGLNAICLLGLTLSFG